MQTFDQAIISAYQAGLISEETAVIYSTRKAIVQRGIDRQKQQRGEKTTDIDGLKLDLEYRRKMKPER